MTATTVTYDVVGMTCAHCVHAVSQEVAALPGVSDVRVDLVPAGTSRVHVTSDAALDPADVAAAVDEAGYALAGQR